MHMIRSLAALAFVLISSASFAETSREAVIEKWYDALARIDRAEFASIIADNATISLNDLDTEQTKAEFIDSLDEWQDAMKDATIRHKIEETTPETISVLVCYQFPDNESLGREVFRIEGGKVMESAQSTIGDSCAEY